MGHFGTSSDDNDTSWDVLGRFRDRRAGGGFPSRQIHADAMAAWIMGGFRGDETYYAKQDESDTVLGPIIYVLRQGLKLPRPLLTRALSIARSKRMDKGYLDCWREREERIDALDEEIILIKKALDKIAKDSL